MNSIEDRIRRARPTHAYRGMPLTDRADRELLALLNKADEASSADNAPETGGQPIKHEPAALSAKPPAPRIRRWVLAACVTAVAGAVGYQLLSGDDSSPLADQDNTLESGGSDADYETFGTADEALA